MMITKKIFRISSIIPCLLCVAISFAQDKFFCDFEDPNSCQWTQDKSDDFDWTRNQASTPSEGTGPLTDHTKGSGPLTNKKQGPGSIQHSGGLCIHVLRGAHTRPIEGQILVTYVRCGEDRLEFQLLPNGILTLTRYAMCVKPVGLVTDGVLVGVFSSCNVTDTWNWTAQGSLQYKKKMCLKPEYGVDPKSNEKLVLYSVCNERQNFFEFVPTSGWYLYIEASSPRRPNDIARLISPSTTKAKSCFLFFYHMFGRDVGKLQVYVKSRGKMDSVWSLSGDQGNKWHQAQVAVNNQTVSYQYVIEGVCGKDYRGDIAIDDIFLIHSSCRDIFFCDFEDPNSCQWTQDKSDDFDWTRNQASTPLEGTGPLTDHTKGSASGWYFYIEASSPRQPNDTARLISPSTTETKSCLLFFYHMYGRHVGKLRVYVKSGGKMYPVWSRSGEQGDSWYQAQVPVNNQPASYQYVIEGVRGKGGLGEIAIDDISFMDSCPPRETSILPSRIICGSEDKGTTDDSSRIIIIATTGGAGVFLSIVLIVLLIKYKRLKRSSKLSTPVNIPLETNEISPEPLPVDEESVYETILNVDRKFHENVATNANESEDISAEGRASLHDRIGVPSNGDNTSEYKTPVENEYQGSRNETVARVNGGFCDDVDTNAEISAEDRTSDHEEVEVPSNAHKVSGHTELNKPPDTLKTGATGDGDYHAFLNDVDIYVIPTSEEPQHETPGQNETCKEPKLSPENSVYTELDVNRVHGRNTTEDGTYQKLVKRDYVIQAHEGRESYEDMKMGGNLADYEKLDQSKLEAEI